jgi:hypothetical protein
LSLSPFSFQILDQMLYRNKKKNKARDCVNFMETTVSQH